MLLLSANQLNTLHRRQEYVKVLIEGIGYK